MVLASAAGEVDTQQRLRPTLHVPWGWVAAARLCWTPSTAEPARAAFDTEPKPDHAGDEDNDREDNDRNDDEPVHDNQIERNDGPEDASAKPWIGGGADWCPDTMSVSAWTRDAGLATTKLAARLFDQLRNKYAHVIVATPPVLTTITASVVSEYADGVLLMLSLGTTRRRDLGHAADNLRATGAPLTGVVLCVAQSAPDIVGSDNDRKRSGTVVRRTR